MLILLLGNPTDRYRETRHNLGWWVGDILAERAKVGFKAGKGDFLIAEGRIAGQVVRMVKPTTYMNLSGVAVDQYAGLFGLEPAELIVVADDIDLVLGQIRIRERGSSGGHNGLASVIEHLGTEEFVRLRCGVGPVPESVDPAEFVLDQFAPDELIVARQMAMTAADAVAMIVARGPVAAANVYNRKPPAPEKPSDGNAGAQRPGEGE
ncbi:MAG: aminoacyl-tRNA hydrolase [candidate division Zixibacteria bacterium]|nr:aminoacyl-tRNA hydrolase [candidate division Zixibacteria bacterium]